MIYKIWADDLYEKFKGKTELISRDILRGLPGWFSNPISLQYLISESIIVFKVYYRLDFIYRAIYQKIYLGTNIRGILCIYSCDNFEWYIWMIFFIGNVNKKIVLKHNFQKFQLMILKRHFYYIYSYIYLHIIFL